MKRGGGGGMGGGGEQGEGGQLERQLISNLVV